MIGEVAINSRIRGYRGESLLCESEGRRVYIARHAQLGAVALKVIDADRFPSARARALCVSQLKLASGIDHPSACQILEVGESGGVVFVAYRLVTAVDLATLIVSRGRLPYMLAAQLIAQVAGALDALHARGLLHRGVKPANILVGGEGPNQRAYLVDPCMPPMPGDPYGLRPDMLPYAAPESFSSEPLDSAADFYALACVMFEAVTGALPYSAQTREEAIDAHLYSAPPSIGRYLGGYVAGVDAVLARALAKQPGERFASGEELSRALRAAAKTRVMHTWEDTLALQSTAITQAAGPRVTSTPRDARDARRPRGAPRDPHADQGRSPDVDAEPGLGGGDPVDAVPTTDARAEHVRASQAGAAARDAAPGAGQAGAPDPQPAEHDDGALAAGDLPVGDDDAGGWAEADAGTSEEDAGDWADAAATEPPDDPAGEWADADAHTADEDAEPGAATDEDGEPGAATDEDGEPGAPTDEDGEPGAPTDEDGEAGARDPFTREHAMLFGLGLALVGLVVFAIALAGLAGGGSSGKLPARHVATSSPPRPAAPVHAVSKQPAAQRAVAAKPPRPVTAPPVRPPAPTIAQWPANRTAYTVVIMVAANDRATIVQRARQALSLGVPVGVLRSDDFPPLPAGDWVAFAGEFADSAAAQNEADLIRARGLVPYPYVRLIVGRSSG